jgi:hypothetical protein
MMKRTLFLLIAISGVFAVAQEARADWTPACLAAAKAAEPTADQLAACLSPDPVLTVEASAGYAIGGGLTLFARADRRLGPAWATVRARYNTRGHIQADLIGGFVLWHSFKVAWVKYVSSQTTTTETITLNKNVVRRDLVASAGVKGIRSPDDTSTMTTDESGTTAAALVGLQWHNANGFGNHEIIELYAARRLGGDGWGALASWHNAIPPTGRLTFGMEAAALPTVSGGFGYWALIELGFAMDL